MSEVIDNRANRVRTMKSLIQRLHAGESPEIIKGLFRTIVRETDAVELVATEQELLAEGVPVEQLRGMCDLHSQIAREVLVQLPKGPGPAPGHPVDTFHRENEALGGVVRELRAAAEEGELFRWRKAANDLMDIDKHYQRKEHALFSKLEKHGITGPSKVMWAKDDDVREFLKQMQAELHGDVNIEAARAATVRAAAAVEEMISKEENILLPMAQSVLTAEDWGEIWRSSPKYGWCLVEPREGYKPPVSTAPVTIQMPKAGALELPTGFVSLEQFAAIFAALPIDLTFVDADDRVAFFTEGPERVFARSKAIIGRKVQHCHPPRSVDVVDRILADFREGRQSVAEFWIEFHGRFVHIRYFAVRGEDGGYLGTVELTQDVTGIRALTGERRLLEYAAAAPSSAAGHDTLGR
ncbi:MAG TPA: DUF438 domain-containing protein [Solibacterales bacterium]|nr:DUF438 domain-containing protein [Bryobacterales bacterium]